jgi:pilus assembly protein CpaB
VRQVPERFTPPDALASPAEAAGARLIAPVAAGGYLTSGALERGANEGGVPGRPGAGERAMDVAVAGGADLQAVGPGARVDVLVTSGQDGGRGRSYLALEDLELLGARPLDGQAGSGGGEGAAAHASAVATLRVTVRQAVFLAAAESFAREVRVLVRPPGERRARRAVAVDGGSV